MQRREPDYVTVLSDGTVKQVNPFTGTEVWTVAGRANRPLGVTATPAAPLGPADHDHRCAFCPARYLETPPEKSRVVRSGDGWRTLYRTPAEELFATVAEFRRVPNLFEILGFDYWHRNYGFELPARVRDRRDAYLATPAGRSHVLGVVAAKLRASGLDDAAIAGLPESERLALASGFFGGGHDLVVARRHFVDGAVDDSQLASSGTLTPEEHERFIAYTIESARMAYDLNPHARYVAVFQNWLKPAGASFDHLHKQLVTIDEHGAQHQATLARLRANPNLFNEAGPNYAARFGLIIAESDHAVALAGYGHRFPTIEIYSTAEASHPWAMGAAEMRGMSDMIHAMHAATGPGVPTNEEWHYRPMDVAEAMPWRVNLKWRVSTLAGFEGATSIYLNTVAPATLRDRVVTALLGLRDRGLLAAGLAIGDEASGRPDPLRYRT